MPFKGCCPPRGLSLHTAVLSSGMKSEAMQKTGKQGGCQGVAKVCLWMW